MAISIPELLSGIRYGLGDTLQSNYRWAESHLLDLLNECLRDLTREHRLLTGSAIYTSSDGSGSFRMLNIPDIVTATSFIDRTNDIVLTFRSIADMYRDFPAYMTAEANIANKPLYICKQKNADWNEYSIYPIPTALDIELRYQRLHSKMLTINSVIELPDMYETALKHYVLGSAVRENNDTQNREFGLEHLKMYEIEKTKLGAYAQESYMKQTLYTERSDRNKR